MFALRRGVVLQQPPLPGPDTPGALSVADWLNLLLLPVSLLPGCADGVQYRCSVQGTCFAHSLACGSGTCCFLMAKMTRLLVIRKNR